MLSSWQKMMGRINLYRLVSWSHLDYYSRRPRIPKSVLDKYREGLLIGSACEAGELYQALLRGAPDAEIARLVNFYDYLEIQPLGNNAFMLRDEKSTVKTEEDLIEINKRIVDLGTQFGKLVCATCDVHFLDRRMRFIGVLSWLARDLKILMTRHLYTCVLRKRCWMSLLIWDRIRHTR